MSAHRAVLPMRIRRKWDRLALRQLSDVLSEQSIEIESLRSNLYVAEDAAEHWREQAERLQAELIAATAGEPGLTRDGALVVRVRP